MDQTSNRIRLPILLTLVGLALGPTGFGYLDGERRFSRVHAIEFSVEGYAPFKDKVTSLDVGVLELRNTEGAIERCEILEPRPESKAAKSAWAPLDFYTNVVHESEDEIAERHGEKDIFFDGDNNNRNGKDDSHLKTLTPLASFADCLRFSPTKESFSTWNFPLEFRRGRLSFEVVLHIEAKVEEPMTANQRCIVVPYLCIDVDPQTHSCREHGWHRELHAIIARADLIEGGLEKAISFIPFGKPAMERQKNDIKSIEGRVTDIDADGKRSEPHPILLAPKSKPTPKEPMKQEQIGESGDHPQKP